MKAFFQVLAALGVAVTCFSVGFSLQPSPELKLNCKDCESCESYKKLQRELKTFKNKNRKPSNIAIKATTKASTVHSTSSQYNSANVNDEDLSTEWAAYGLENQWIKLEWNSPYYIKSIKLFDRINSVDQVLKAKISFSDGTDISCEALPNGGVEPNFIKVEKESIDSLIINLSKVKGLNAGLTEVEVYGWSDDNH